MIFNSASVKQKSSEKPLQLNPEPIPQHTFSVTTISSSERRSTDPNFITSNLLICSSALTNPTGDGWGWPDRKKNVLGVKLQISTSHREYTAAALQSPNVTAQHSGSSPWRQLGPDKRSWPCLCMKVNEWVRHTQPTLPQFPIFQHLVLQVWDKQICV